MLTVDRAFCIVLFFFFSDDDLPLENAVHTRPFYITIGYSGHRVSFVLLDNGLVDIKCFSSIYYCRFVLWTNRF